MEYPEVKSIQGHLQRSQDEMLERSYGPPRPVTPFYKAMEMNKEDESENWPTVEFENLTGLREGQGASGSRAANFISLLLALHQTQLIALCLRKRT